MVALEPALHPDFERIVEAVIETKKEMAPGAKTAILSNSTSVTRGKIRRALTRGFPAKNLCPLNKDSLLWARDQVVKAGISAEAF